MEDFNAAMNKLSVDEERQLLADIKTGKMWRA
jgi:hypothetical protein